METSLRNWFVFSGIACGVLAIITWTMFPWLVAWIALQAIVLKLCLRRVDEPQRAIIMRLGQMHHLAASGLVFLVPLYDALGSRITMKPVPQKFTVYQLGAQDGSSIYLNLELFWRFRPDIDRITTPLKQTMLKDDTELKAMVEQAVTVVARQLVLSYTPDQLKRADSREALTDVLRSSVNEVLSPHGIQIETIFWRGSIPSSELLQERLAITLSRERLRAMIADVQTVQEELPSMSAEQFLAFQAWLELLKKGLPAPNLPPYISGTLINPHPHITMSAMPMPSKDPNG